MRRVFIATALLLSHVFCGTAQDKPFMDDLPYYVENTAVFGLGQEEGRAYHIPESGISLNGRWKFFYAENPAGIPSDFYKPSFNDRKWDGIDVPSNWEMQGFGQAVFRNTRTPFHPNPPKTPELNPTGAYRTEFTVPSSWKGNEVFLRFEKVASASFVWVNGQQVGYNEGAQEPAEYDITKYVKPGRNSLAVLVLKYSDGYYLEGQDYWRLAGIFDDVTLYSTGALRIRDWQVITDFDSSFTDSDLSLDVAVRSYGTAACCRVKARISKDGSLVAEMDGGRIDVPAGGESVANLRAKVASPLKWTAETPDLYDLTMELTDASGRIVESITKKIGFKKTEIRDGVFYLNGSKVKLNGICSHMQHPELGHAMDEATIRKDMELLKQFNFNTVRTSHYPPVNRYLELADEYGIYVVDETGDESHATEFVSELPDWAPMYRERARQMVLRDRNHACVLFWSAGNESGNGPNIAEAIEEGRKYDPTRSWMYGGNAPKHPAEEIVGPRYPIPLTHELEYGLNSEDLRPSFMDEYVSVAGNGGCGFDEFWREIYIHDTHLGGAVWDFVSPGLREPVRLLEDKSPNSVQSAIFGKARLVKGRSGLAIDLNKQDQWVQVYRDDALEISGDGLTISMDVYPRANLGEDNYLLTKGSRQYGLVHRASGELEFYLDNGSVQSLTVPVPAGWLNGWHSISAVYDGSVMEIHIDGIKAGSKAVSGKIRNLPLAVCIGRDEQKHGQETEETICDAMVDNVAVFAAAVRPTDSAGPSKAALWLDFEGEKDGGEFFSYGLGARTYGCIWPDRTPQPEMYQMKKSAQPLDFALLDSRDGTLKVTNRSRFLNSSAYRTIWTLNADSDAVASGELDLNLAPEETGIFTIPYVRPAIEPGKEYRITVSSVLRKDEMWAPAGHEVAWEQFEIPDWYVPVAPASKPAGKVLLAADGQSYKVTGEGFTYSFDASSGELRSMVVAGRELLKSPLKFNLWRAPVANEVDGWDGFTAMSGSYANKRGYGVAGSEQTIASMYYVAHLNDPVFIPTAVDAWEASGSAYVDVRELVVFGGYSDPDPEDIGKYLRSRGLAGFESIWRYRVDADGTITARHYLNPQGNLPEWLPRIGVTMTLDGEYDNVRWYGRGPQSSYPDRKSGYRVGIYESTVEDMYEPYLIPQDYGLRMDSRWVEFTGDSGEGLRISVDGNFAFNAYPFTTDNLTKADYTFQLVRSGDVTVNLDYETTGVGETANGTFRAYRTVADETYDRTITIVPIRM